jgi:3D (Asp-Asp-Asp) domain-containing protein
LCGCATLRPPRDAGPPVTRTLRTTGYCPCEKCCSWQRDKSGQPVYSSGPLRGRPKKVGITASGTRARQGTIAADLRYYPFGTVMFVDGYGFGRVEDSGGAIKGEHIDLFFRRHRQALQWGVKKKPVQIWFPR